LGLPVSADKIVEVRACLEKNGGVIGITFGEGFVNPKDAEALRAAIKIETNAPLLTGRALDDYAAEDVRKLFGTRVKVASTVEDVADHIDHAVKIAGIDHVGIGSDFDGVSGPPNGLDDSPPACYSVTVMSQAIRFMSRGNKDPIPTAT